MNTINYRKFLGFFAVVLITSFVANSDVLAAPPFLSKGTESVIGVCKAFGVFIGKKSRSLRQEAEKFAQDHPTIASSVPAAIGFFSATAAQNLVKTYYELTPSPAFTIAPLTAAAVLRSRALAWVAQKERENRNAQIAGLQGECDTLTQQVNVLEGNVLRLQNLLQAREAEFNERIKKLTHAAEIAQAALAFANEQIADLENAFKGSEQDSEDYANYLEALIARLETTLRDHLHVNIDENQPPAPVLVGPGEDPNNVPAGGGVDLPQPQPQVHPGGQPAIPMNIGGYDNDDARADDNGDDTGLPQPQPDIPQQPAQSPAQVRVRNAEVKLAKLQRQLEWNMKDDGNDQYSYSSLAKGH